MNTRTRSCLLAALGSAVLAMPVLAQNVEDGGLVIYESEHDFSATIERIEPAVKARGLFLMRVMDHSAAAAQVGRELGPNTVALFGNPQVGSQVMGCAPTAGIDLPQKLLVWVGDGASVLVAYNDPQWLKLRHSIEGCDAVLDNVRQALDSIARDVAGIAVSDPNE